MIIGLGVVHRQVGWIDTWGSILQLSHSLRSRAQHVFARSADASIAHARNMVCRQLLAQQSDVIVLVDDDQLVTIEMVDRLLALNVPFASGLYISRGTPTRAVAIHRTPEDGPCSYRTLNVQEIDGQQPLEVDAVGMGLVVIRREVFEKTTDPWFTCGQGIGRPDIVREDMSFCEQVRGVGIPIVVDPTVRVPHLGMKAVIPGPKGTVIICDTHEAIEMAAWPSSGAPHVS